MFEFYSAGKVIFGSGTFSQFGNLAQVHGTRALLVLGGSSLRKTGVVDRMVKLLEQNSVRYSFYEGINYEPEIETIDTGVAIVKETGCDVVVAVGGGSVLDTGKAIAGVVTNGGSVFDYLEGVGAGKEITKPALPFIAIPTTAGTGSEVTKNSVISSKEKKFKVSIRSPLLIPKVALVDPELTVSLPPEPTAYSGLDALTQLIEPYVSKKANPITDAFASHGIRLVADSLSQAYHDGGNLAAREKMAVAALLSGYTLANAGLGAVHALARPLGAYYSIPHGLACAILLPYIIELNLNFNLQKYAEIGEVLTKQYYRNQETAAGAGVEFVRNLNKELNVPKDFKRFHINPDDISVLIQGAQGASLRDNPRTFSIEELTDLLKELV
jgi:alcohol dehydrogenase class IV